MQTNIIVNSNNVDYLKTLPNDCIDFVVTSPPYDDLRTYKGFTLDIQSLGKELFRVMKPGGLCVWVVQDACQNKVRTGTSFRTVVQWLDIGWNLWDTLIYFRRGVFAHKTRFRTDHEYMFCFMKGNEMNYYEREHMDVPNPSAGKKMSGAKTRRKDGSQVPTQTWVGKETKCRGTISNYNFGGDGSKLKHEHPAVFPDLLALDMIECFCPPGGIVLDPFNGSGTTCVAAKSCGRQYIGIDISPEYIKIAEKRLEQEVIKRGNKMPEFAAVMKEEKNQGNTLDEFFV